MIETSTFITFFLIYWAIVAILDKKGILERYNISTYGPVLMIRTTRGQDLLNFLARPKKFWRVYANLGIVLMFVGMLAMFLIIILSDVAMIASIGDSSMPEPGKFNEARNIFLIPGVNEFIPLTWGIIALVVTLVVHEFSHAILCRVEDIRVKSMGILLALVPVGGFAEPDENELFGVTREEEAIRPNVFDPDQDIRLVTEKPVVKPAGKVADREQRARILAAGVMSNFTFAFLAFLLLFGPVLGAISPISDAMIVNVTPDSPADLAGIEEGMIITKIDDTQIEEARDVILYMDGVESAGTVILETSKDRVRSSYELKTIADEGEKVQGIYVNDIVTDSPAQASGIEKGMLIVRIDDVKINSSEDFILFMNDTFAGQSIVVETVRTDNTEENFTYVIELASHPEGLTDKGFLGIYYGSNGIRSVPLGISIGEFPAKTYLEMLRSIPSMLDGVTGWVIIFGLPIIGFSGEGFPGFSGTLAQFYEPVGWGEPLGVGLFWIANSLLWIGWLNFYVGLFNCLPAVPLDGGHVFKDYLFSFINKFIKDEDRAIRLTASIAGSLTLLVLMSFVFMIFGPYLVHGF